MYARDHGTIATPIGTIHIVAEHDALISLSISNDPAAVSRGTSPLVRQALDQIDEFFAGARQYFELPLAAGATPRGEALRQGIVSIGYGETASYGALARAIASSPRAIGQACARNPFPIIVPCHRVLGSGNVLGAYSAGDGPATKAWLIEHERRHKGAAA